MRPSPIGSAALLLTVSTGAFGAGTRLLLERWTLRSSAEIQEKGDVLSRTGFRTDGWHAVKVPNTVLGALVEAGHFPDPYFGMNLRAIPGTTYPIGERFTLLPTPEDSPFKPSWWYRTEFELPSATGQRTTWLRFDGINYRANLWVNGTRIASSDEIAGAFRQYELDVTSLVHRDGKNAVAVEVFGPEPHDLAFMWVDWNPTPADKNMGLWEKVYVGQSGPVALRHPHVAPDLHLPSLDRASLTVTAELWNATDRPQTALVRGNCDDREFSKSVPLAPRERTAIRFTPADTPELDIRNPRVWWPYRHGSQHLYELALEVEVEGEVSDSAEVTFGIQEMTSELTPEGHRLFRVNGKPILVRGAGWASDMLLRQASTERLEAELRYVKEMGLNTVRLEGKLESDEFYDLADRHGILLMPGWCCCDQWEMWDKWDAEDHRVAPASLSDQIKRIRNHPSVLVWLNGSDFPPPADVEKNYLNVLESCEWRKPVLSNATDAPGPLSGPTGVKMRGPYDYVPPAYWLFDKEHGGAFGFATEVGPGAAVPPIESLERMLGRDHLWPIDDVWRFHAGGDEFKDLKLFTEALEARYGKAEDAQDYARKAQALAYEGERAMFEAFGRNKYLSTGVIQWMLNNAWPSMIWHLYDYYLRPGGGYFGTKKANEPIHVQYSYDDRSIVVVNDLHRAFPGTKVSAQVLDGSLQPRFSEEVAIDVEPDSVHRALVVPHLEGLEGVYFVRLRLEDSSGKTVSENFYWLSHRDDELDWEKTEWYYTPTRRHADLTALADLPETSLAVSKTFETADDELRGRVRVENRGRALAFQIRLKAVDPATGEEVLPVFWEDNYFALFPGEKREILVSYPRRSGQETPSIEVEAWNVAKSRH